MPLVTSTALRSGEVPRRCYDECRTRDRGMNGVRYELMSQGKILVLTTGPRFTTDDLLDTMRSAFGDPAVRRPLKLLLDNRGSKESASSTEVQRRAALLGSLTHLLLPHMAVVVSDDLHYGLARMGAAYVEESGFSVAVFRDFDEARVWLEAL